MQKDHLIQLHAFFVQIKNYMEMMYEEDYSELFLSYNALNVHPHEIHKSKDKQQIAIFELIKGISKIAAEKDKNPENFQKISKNLECYCERIKKRMNK